MAHGEVTLPFGNVERPFNVAKHRQMFELQDKCGLNARGPDGETILIPCGPAEIFERLRANRWREADVVWPIHLGLVGAGMPVGEVTTLMKEFVHDQPLGPLAPLAARILMAAVYGISGDDLGKPTAEGAKSEVENSASSAPRNMARGRRSVSRRGKSTK